MASFGMQRSSRNVNVECQNPVGAVYDRAYFVEVIPLPENDSTSDSQLGRTVLRLRELILKGEFGPRERISEHPLSARLGVSRTPIRLALERLAHEGLLEPYPTGGFIVRQFTLDDIWDGIEIRSLLEGGAARLAAERLNDDKELDP